MVVHRIGAASCLGAGGGHERGMHMSLTKERTRARGSASSPAPRRPARRSGSSDALAAVPVMIFLGSEVHLAQSYCIVVGAPR
mmetsp:Transcript_25870/g.89238  ORF Transcript_25870/g.89238 Transcript_25870/m.89238 type:complete len:83 (-) Transcript_25870:195-443(-)